MNRLVLVFGLFMVLVVLSGCVVSEYKLEKDEKVLNYDPLILDEFSNKSRVVVFVLID